MVFAGPQSAVASVSKPGTVRSISSRLHIDHEIISKAILDIVGQLSVAGEYMYTY